MTDDALQVEVQQLRQQVEEYRARELETLQSQLAEARDAVFKWRQEAYRLDGVLKQLAAQHDAKVAELRSKIDTMEQIRSNVQRR